MIYIYIVRLGHIIINKQENGQNRPNCKVSINTHVSTSSQKGFLSAIASMVHKKQLRLKN